MRAGRFLLTAVTLILVTLTTFRVDARLPKPERAEGVILAIHLDTQTLVLKASKPEKPLLLHWDVETEFRTSDQQISPAKVKPGDNVVIYCKRISFRNPLLKKVIVLPSARIRSKSGRSNE